MTRTQRGQGRAHRQRVGAQGLLARRRPAGTRMLAFHDPPAHPRGAPVDCRAAQPADGFGDRVASPVELDEHVLDQVFGRGQPAGRDIRQLDKTRELGSVDGAEPCVIAHVRRRSHGHKLKGAALARQVAPDFSRAPDRGSRCRRDRAGRACRAPPGSRRSAGRASAGAAASRW